MAGFALWIALSGCQQAPADAVDRGRRRDPLRVDASLAEPARRTRDGGPARWHDAGADRDAGSLAEGDRDADASWPGALPDAALDLDDAGAESTPPTSLHVCPEGREFCDVTGAAGLRDVTGYGRGAAFVDVDVDGWDDLFVVDTDGRLREGPYGVSRIYRNLGQGRFERIDAGFADADLFATWVGAFADYDNDGDPDVLLASGGYTHTSTLALYENRMREEGRFVDVTAAAGLAPLNAVPDFWWGATWGDYDGDGFLDAAVTRRTGQPLLLHNEQDGSFRECAASVGVALSLASVGNPDIKNPLFFDHDGDGDMDLYIAGIGVHGLFDNRGVDGFVEVTGSVFGSALDPASPYVFAVAVSDFDQDGRDDLYLGRWDRQDLVMRNLGLGVFEPLGPGIGLVTSLHGGPPSQPFENTMGLGVGDLFDDGLPDLFLGTGDPNRSAADVMFCNGGVAGFTRCTDLFDDPLAPGAATRGHAIVFADVDHDGDTDVFRNLGGHPPFDIQSGQDSREYGQLHVRAGEGAPTAALTLRGVASNRDAIGAHVEVHSTPPRFYAVRSTQAFQAQNSRTLSLRLDDVGATAVTVHWPAGGSSELSLSPGQRLEALEPAP